MKKSAKTQSATPTVYKIITVDSTNDGHIYISTDNGSTWIPRGPGQTNWYTINSTSDGMKMFAQGQVGYLYTSFDGGLNWVQRNVSGAGNSNYFNGLALSSDGTKIFMADYKTGALAGSGYFYSSVDSGVTWTSNLGEGTHYWGNIACSADGLKLAAVESGLSYAYIYRSTDGGATWNTTGQPDGGTSHQYINIASSQDGSNLVVGAWSLDYIYTSTDSGATWTKRVAAGTGYWNAVACSSDGMKILAANNNNYIAPGGYIWRSDDGGATWVQLTALGQHVWRTVACSSDGKITAAGIAIVAPDVGGMYISTDGGVNWTSNTAIGSRDCTTIKIIP